MSWLVTLNASKISSSGALRAEVERLGQADVPGEVGVVPADRVPLEDVSVGADAILGGLDGALAGAHVVRSADLRGRLRRIGAHPVVQVEVARQDAPAPRR